MELNRTVINDSVFDATPSKTSYSASRGQINCSLCKQVYSKCKSDPLKEFYNLHPGIKSDNYDKGALFIVDSYPNDAGRLFKDRDVASLLNSLLVESKVDNYYILPSVKCDVEKLGINATAKVRDNCFELSKLIIKQKLNPRVVITDSVSVFNQITGLKFVSSGRIANSIGWSSELNCYVMIILKLKTLIDDKRMSEEKVIESVRLANLKKGFSLIKIILNGEYKEHIIRHDKSKINYRKLTLNSKPEEIEEYFNKLYSCKQAAFDIETTGLNVFFDTITMMAITMEVGEAMNFSKEFMDAHREKFQKFFSHKDIEKIVANGSFDVSFLMYDGYTFDGKITDVQVYNYLNRNGLDYDVSLSGIKYSNKNKGKGSNTLKFLSWIYTDLGGYEQTIKKQGGIVDAQVKKLAGSNSGKKKKSKSKVDQNLELFQEVIKNNISPNSNLTLDDAKKFVFEGEVEDISLTEVEEYNCTDTDATFRIKLLLVDKSEERVHNVYNTLLGPLIFEVLTNIYLKGIKVDLSYLDQLKLKYKGSDDGEIVGLIDKIRLSFEQELKREIAESGKFTYNDIVSIYPEESQFDKNNPNKDLSILLSNIDININSSKQILLLYKKLGYLSNTDDSVDGDVLYYLANKGIKSAEYKSQYQPVNKLYTTYILPFIKKNIDGFLHSSYQTNLVTGRLSSSDPNMQNIPADNEIRNICIARDGYSYIDMDYSAAELRVLAEVSDQEDWIEGFKNDFDPHWAMARKMFSIPLQDRPKIDKMNSLISVGDWLATLGILKPGFNINDPMVISIISEKIKDLEKKRSASKCISPESLIHVNGTFRRIGKIIPNYIEEDKFLNSNNENIWNGEKNIKISQYYRNIDDEQILIISQKNIIVCSKNHQLKLEDGSLKRAADISTEDILYYSIPPQLPDNINTVTLKVNPAEATFTKSVFSIDLTEDWAYMAGVFVGDGCFSGGALGVSAGEYGKYLNWRSVLKEHWGKIGLPLEDRFYVKSRANYMYMGSIVLIRLFEQLQLVDSNMKSVHGSGRKILRVPQWVFDGGRKFALQFLAGLVDSDGYTDKCGSMRICTKDYYLAQDVSVLCAACGIDYSLNISWNKTYKRDYYIIRISARNIDRLLFDNLLKCPWKRDKLISINSGKKRQEILKPNPNRVKKVSNLGIGKLLDIEVNSDDHLYWTNNLITHNTINFATAYGSGAKGIAEQIYQDFKFVGKDQQKKYINEAKIMIDSWFKAANKIKLWLDNTHKFAKEHKYVETILGRRRYLVFADSNYKQFSASAMREAGNTPIQSIASDMCAYAAVQIQRHIRNFPKDDCRIVNIVHDNIMLEVPDHRVDYYAPIAVDLMQNKSNFLKRVPMKVDYQVTKKWVK